MQSLPEFDAALALLSAVANEWAADARRGDANALETLATWLGTDPETLRDRLNATQTPTRQTLRLR